MGDQLVQIGYRAACRVAGAGERWVVMSHSLGCNKDMWNAQVDALAKNYRVLTYDLPGHGNSEVTGRKGSLDALADDLLKLLDFFAIDQAAFVGVSVGGMIGQVAVTRQPHRFSGLVLSNTGSQMPESALPDWEKRISVAQEAGLTDLARSSFKRWFTDKFQREHPALISALEQQFQAVSVAGYIECCEAIMGLDTTHSLPAVQLPVLVISGSEDPGSGPVVGKRLCDLLPNARQRIFEGSGHLTCIDREQAFNAACDDFLSSLEGA